VLAVFAAFCSELSAAAFRYRRKSWAAYGLESKGKVKGGPLFGPCFPLFLYERSSQSVLLVH
jgi:hypothetical protein